MVDFEIQAFQRALHDFGIGQLFGQHLARAPGLILQNS